MSANRAASRLARRELRRRAGRTVLVVALVAIPVAAMIIGAGVARTIPLPNDVRAAKLVGGATARVTLNPAGGFAGDSGVVTSGAPVSTQSDLPTFDQITAKVRAADPAARLAEVRRSSGLITPANQRRIDITVDGGPLDDPLVAPHYEVKEGRLPNTNAEIAVSPALAEALGTRVGARVAIPELDVDATVVGVAQSVGSKNEAELLVHRMPDLVPDQVGRDIYIALSNPKDRAAWSAVTSIGPNSGISVHPDLSIDPVNGRYFGGPFTYNNDQDSAQQTVLGGLAVEALTFVVLALVISVAFALGARKQLRTLGLVAANGGSPTMVRALVLWQGLWCGVIGAVAGLAIGVAGLAGLWNFRGSILSHDATWWRLSALDVIPIMVIGVVAALGSSYLPARSAGQLSVLQALAGRRPLRPVRPRLVLGGTISALCGLALIGMGTIGSRLSTTNTENTIWAAITIVGVLGVMAGAVAASQVAVGLLGSVGARLSRTARLAFRSVARQRTRYGAVVAGICAAAALALAASTVAASQMRAPTSVFSSVPDNAVVATRLNVGAGGATLAPGPSQLAAIQRIVGPAVTVEWRSLPVDVKAIDGDQNYLVNRDAALATPELIDAMRLTTEQRDALVSTGIIVLDGPRDAEVRLYNQGAAGPVHPSVAFPRPRTPQSSTNVIVGSHMPQVLVTPDVLARAKISPPDVSATIVLADRPLTIAQKQELAEMTGGPLFRLVRNAESIPAGFLSIMLPQQPSPAAPDPTLATEVVLAAIALVFSALVIAIGLALASADSQDERDILNALGAPPKLIRRIDGIKAGSLALTGALLAIPVGILPVYVVKQTSVASPPTSIPWAALGILVVATPLIMTLATMSGSGLKARFRPVTASRFSDD